jgi:hypothetical protein
MNRNAYQGLIEAHIRQRQLTLWNTITKLYEVEDSLNAQVHKWIEEGIVTEKVNAKIIGKGIKYAVPHDDTPTVLP